MNPIKFKQVVNKKVLLKSIARLALVSFALYGVVAGYNNFTTFSVRQYNGFIAHQADAMGIVKTEVKTQYVVDPEKATQAVSAAAQEGAQKGADASIKANLGK